MRISVYQSLSLDIGTRGVTVVLKQVVRACAGLLLIAASVACATEHADTNIKINSSSAGADMSKKITDDGLTKAVMNNEKPEAISGFKFDGSTIFADVISHGCTRNNDFRIDHSVDDNHCAIVITRVKPDLCRRAPMIQTIEIQWQLPDDCNSLPIIMLNPILVAPKSGLMSKRLK